MALQLGHHLMDLAPQLRYEPVAKRIRAYAGDAQVVDSTSAVLVWEPGRVVPTYAVPLADLLVPVNPSVEQPAAEPPRPGSLIFPDQPFTRHSTPGQALDLLVPSRPLTGAAFRPDDPDLREFAVLDFGALDRWVEEDEEIMAHPHDPFARIDIRESSRHVRVELDGEVLAESTRPRILFETGLPPRYYLPPEDVRQDLLRPSPSHTVCAYKGQASYHSLTLGDRVIEDLVWHYPDPLIDAAAVGGYLSFYNEKVDIIVDGQRGDRPRTEWS